MIGPIQANDLGDGWDLDPGTQAVWRERERRQRTVRLLMMFLLMLLLMDGEEQTTRNGRNPVRKPIRSSKRATVLDEEVFGARRDQEELLRKVSVTDPRFLELMERNGGVNVESQIRKWTEESGEKDGSKKVFHFPWNATGFYRGEWAREGEEEEDEDRDDGSQKETDERRKEYKFLTPMDLEKPMQKRMREMEENVGVFLLPRGTKIKTENATKTDASTAAETMSPTKTHPPSSSSSSSYSWLRMGNFELNQVVEPVADDDTESAPHMTLSKVNGRAAFQIYSRSVPTMKELSLVDGFIKLYDSSTVGYSTRRDILLRVKGVIIHSIGRISLVSNAAPGRSALIISDNVSKPKKKQPTPTSDPPSGEANERRRLLQHSIQQLDQSSDENAISRIRDEVFAMDDLETDGGGWQLLSSFFETEDSVFPQHDVKSWFESVIDSFWRGDESHSSQHSKPRRRLSDDTLGTNRDSKDLVENNTENPHTEDEYPNATISQERRMTEIPLLAPPTETKRSRFVIPYPFVPDDAAESVRKTKTPATRRMPAREQLLESNAGRCEFEINLDVGEVAWTVGEWRALMSHRLEEEKMLNPALHKLDSEEENEEEDEEGKTAQAKRPKPAVADRPMWKQSQDQALVMAMVGSIHSPNCDFTASLNATAIRTDWDHTTGKAINYSFYMMLTCLSQIVVLLRQLLHTQAQSAATRVSLLCIGWQTVLDALLCLAHIYLSLAMQPLFTAFASVAFFKLLIFCVIEMKYMAIIIQARNNSNGGQNTAELLRRQIAMLHLRFYIALVVAFLAFFYAGQKYRTIYVLGLYSFWVPQIVQNIVTEAKRPLHNYYIYGISLTRMVAPLYIFGVPNNFLKEVYPDSPTNIFMVEMLLLWVGIQTAILVAQGKYGARFMIPARFLPPKFDYNRPIPPSLLPPEALEPPPESTIEIEGPSSPPLIASEDSPPERKSTGTRNRMKGSRANRPEHSMTTEAVNDRPPPPTLDCVICCNGIDVHNRRGYMLAPCDHIFHRECLVQWMDVKMECPICRTELPSL